MDIDGWRREIDKLDKELLELLNQRARLAIKVGALKQAAGLPLCDPERERFVLERLRRSNAGPLDDEAVAELFGQIIRESRRAQALGAAGPCEVQL